MATRFYLPNTGAAEASPAFTVASWQKTSDADRIKTDVVKIASVMTTRTGAQLAGAPNFILLRQYVSEPLAPQTITGNLTGQIRALQSASPLNATIAILVKVCSNNGASITGTLLPIAAPDTATTPPKMESTVLTNRILLNTSEVTPIPLSSLAVNDGDRLVFELGYRDDDNSGNTARTGSLSFGDDSVTDLAVEDTTIAANNPWIEFDTNLAFQITPTPITKSLKYIVKAAVAITKSLKYTVKTTPVAMTKSLQYRITMSFPIGKSLKYTVKTAIAITKSLKYTVLTTPSAMTKSLQYAVSPPVSILKSLDYEVIAQQAVAKLLRYQVKATIPALTKSLQYVIPATTVEVEITKSLDYGILHQHLLQKGLEYTVRNVINKNLYYKLLLQNERQLYIDVRASLT